MITAGTGIKDLASDLVELVVLYKSHWAAVQTVTHAINPEFLVETGDIGSQILTAIGLREAGEARDEQYKQQKLQVWSLYDTAHEQVRRTAEFFFGAEKANELIPSFRVNSGPPSRRKSEDDAQPTTPASPSPRVRTKLPRQPPDARLATGNPRSSSPSNSFAVLAPPKLLFTRKL